MLSTGSRSLALVVLAVVSILCRAVAGQTECITGLEASVAPGSTLSARIVDDHVLIGTPFGLEVRDLVDIDAPAPVAMVLDRIAISDLVVDGRFGHVVTDAGVTIVDLEDVTAPVVLGTYGDPDVRGVDVAGGRSVTVLVGGRIQVYDVTDPSAPVAVGAPVGGAGFVGDALIDGDIVYQVRGTGTLDVWGLVDGQAPEFITSYTPGPGALGFLDITTDESGRRVLVGAGGSLPAVVRLLDVSDPANPSQISGFTLQFLVTGVTVEGTTLYAADGDVGLYEYDISDPAEPERVWWWFEDMRGSVVGDVAVTQDRLYVPVRGGVAILEVVDGTTPTVTGVLPNRETGRAVAMVGDGEHVYVSGRGGELIVYGADGSGGLSPVGGTLGGSNGSWLALNGDVLHRQSTYQLESFDISDPSSPTLVARLPLRFTALTTDSAPRTEVARDVLAIQVRTGIELFDVADPFAPVFLTRIVDFNIDDFSLDGSGDRLHVIARNSSGPDTYRILDITKPSAPVLVAEYAVEARALRIRGDRVFVVDSQALREIHLEADGTTSEVSSTPIEIVAPRLWWVGDTLAVSGEDGFALFDVSTVGAPCPCDVVEVADGASALLIRDNRVLTSTGAVFIATGLKFHARSDAPICSICSSDVDRDGSVGIVDLLLVLAVWGSVDPTDPADIDGDGQVAFGDLARVLADWGPCPG